MDGNKRVDMVTFTPDVAQVYLDSYPYEGQRKISNQRLRQIQKWMRDGDFTGNNIALATLNGSTYLVNGQHTLISIVETGVPFDMPVEIRQVDSMRDVALWYARIDNQKKRTLDDLYHSTGIDTQLGISRGAPLNTYGTAVRRILSGFSRHESQFISGSTLTDAMLEWVHYYRQYVDLTAHSVVGHQRMRRTALMSVGLATLRYVPDSATDFWLGVCNNADLHDGDPRRTLHYFVLKARVGGGGYYGLDEYQIIRIVAKMWNAHIEGRKVLRIITTATDTPVKLIGTEYTI